MKNNSIWSDYIKKDNINRLNGDIDRDVLVIGGGMTGLSVAYNLINTGLSVAVVEANNIGSGITSRSTAKITYLQENIYSKLCKYHNSQIAYKYFKSQKEAVKIIKKIIKDNKMDCDLEKSPSYLYAYSDKGSKKVFLEKEILEGFKANVNNSNKLPDGSLVKSSIYVNDTYDFNPVKYLNNLKKILLEKDIDIYEYCRVEEIKKYDDMFICKANGKRIKSKYVVLALHYPYFLFPYLMPLKVSLEKSYISAIPIENYCKFNAINLDNDIRSIRYYKNYKIELNNSHNICIKNNESNNFNTMDNNSSYMWSNIDIVTGDYLPIVGTISKKLLIATGYNTWGMTNSTIAGVIIKDIILDRDNPYIKLFDPRREFNMAKFIRYPLIFSCNFFSFINSKINYKKNWYSNNLIIKNIRGKNVGIYTDLNNIKHMVYIKCPHLGCNLIFNEKECTWDCPCHGSRFNIDGKCISSPSNYNISYKKDI